MNGVKQVELVEVAHDDLPASVGMSMFERLARDPSVDVDKLERLMQMHERATARVAEERFNAAMSKAQAYMRTIAVDAYNPQTKSKYASYEAIDRALRPIYTEHGFGVSFDTGDAPQAPIPMVRVLAYVTHLDGFARTYKVDMPADGKGAKGGDVMTLTHATGAAMSYGMRYLLKMIFNVAVGEDDHDGNQPKAPADAPKAPAGFDNWFADMEVAAESGYAVLSKAWKASADALREHVQRIDPKAVERLKAKALTVDKKAGAK